MDIYKIKIILNDKDKPLEVKFEKQESNIGNYTGIPEIPAEC